MEINGITYQFGEAPKITNKDRKRFQTELEKELRKKKPKKKKNDIHIKK